MRRTHKIINVEMWSLIVRVDALSSIIVFIILITIVVRLQPCSWNIYVTVAKTLTLTEFSFSRNHLILFVLNESW